VFWLKKISLPVQKQNYLQLYDICGYKKRMGTKKPVIGRFFTSPFSWFLIVKEILNLIEKSAFIHFVFLNVFVAVLVYNAFSAQECTEVKPAVANFAAAFIHQEFSWQFCFVIIIFNRKRNIKSDWEIRLHTLRVFKCICRCPRI